MHKILLVSRNRGTIEELKKVTDQEIVYSAPEEALSLITSDHSFTTVLIEYPSQLERVREITDYITSGNNYIFSTAVIMITDTERMEADAAFLGGAVVDVISRPISAAVLENRMQNAETLVSSVSFNEFARMLKVLPANIYLKDANGKYVFSSQTWHHLDTGDDPTWTIRGKTDLEIRKDK